MRGLGDHDAWNTQHALGGDSIPTSLAFGRVTNEGLRAAVYSTTPGGVLYEDFAIDQNDWGSQAFATGVAFGDVDGDVFPEFGVTRYHTSGMRAAVFDDTIGDHAPIATVGSDWHSSATAAAIAFGDIDGDGVDEMAVARYAPTGWRVAVFKVGNGGSLSELFTFGDDWGSSYGATDVAFGDIDGDGIDELGVTRRGGDGTRVWVLKRESDGTITELFKTGSGNWGSTAFATSIDFGDFDGDGIDDVAIGRYSTINASVFVYKRDSSGTFSELFSVGSDWPEDKYAVDVALGDFDGDGVAELAIARRATSSDRLMVFQYGPAVTKVILQKGIHWPSDSWATAVAFGELDGEGGLELAVAVKASEGERIRVWKKSIWAPIFTTGQTWGSNYFATSVAVASGPRDVDGDGIPDGWEARGFDVDCDGTIDVPLHTYGADVRHKDLFFEIDWAVSPTRGPRVPPANMLADIKASFAAAPIDAGGTRNPDGQPGINIWFDTGDLTEDGNLVGDDLGGGGPIGDVTITTLRGVEFSDNKAENFAAARDYMFSYIVQSFPKATNDCFSAPRGCAYAGGQSNRVDIVHLGTNSAHLMHEIGHTLNLSHGGQEEQNCKPNYVSIMNYYYSSGIPRSVFDSESIDIDSDGDLERAIIDFSPPRITGNNRGAAPLATLRESDLDENLVLDATDDQNLLVFSPSVLDDNGREDYSRDADSCWNGINDGADGADLDDSDCVTNPDFEGGAGRGTCTNGDDDDGDGLIDALDPDCFVPAGALEDYTWDDSIGGTEPSCSNGIDDGDDGVMDADDPDCQHSLKASYLNTPNDWNLDGVFTDGVSADIDTGGATRKHPACDDVNRGIFETLKGADDWSVIQLGVQHGAWGDLPSQVYEPEPGRRSLLDEILDNYADIGVSISLPSSVEASSNVDVDFVIESQGPETALSVLLRVNLPANVTLTTIPTECAEQGVQVTCQLGDIEAGGTYALTLGLDVGSNQSGQPRLIDAEVVADRPVDPALYNNIAVALLNQSPSCEAATADLSLIWPPNHDFRPLTLSGEVDADGDYLTVSTTAVYQDEPTEGLGDGNFKPDAELVGDRQVAVRAERSGLGDGRVYYIDFSATDPFGGSCATTIEVCVPRNEGGTCIGGGPAYNSIGSE